MFLELLRNAAILMAFCMAYTLLFRSRDRHTQKGRCILGFLFGFAAAFAMLTPTALFPGVLIDSRTIFISMAGLLGGGLSALMASAIAIVCRSSLGGVGAPVGHALILMSALMGLGGYHLNAKKKVPITPRNLYLFGIIVHVGMMLLMLALPDDIRWHVIEKVTGPVLLIYPVGTVLIGLLLLRENERTEAEKARVESEQRLTAILRAAPVGIGVVKDRVILDVNPYICKLTGYLPEDLVGQNARMFYPSEEEYLWVGQEKYKQIAEKGVGTLETRWRCKDGRVIHVLLSSTPLAGKDPSLGTTFTVLDITESKASEKEILRQQTLLERAQEIGQLGTWELDVKKNSLLWTDENCRIFGVPPGTEVTYELFIEKVHPEDREYVDRQWAAALAGSPYDIEHRLLIDGKTKWVREKASVEFDASGSAVSAVGVTQDITERKKAERALHNSEAKYRALVESSSDWIWELDEEGRYSYASPQVKNILGYEAEELIGKTPFDLMASDEVGKISRTFYEIHERADAVVRLENINLHRDGRLVVLETSGVPVLDPDGRVIGYRGVDRDITERKKAESALKESAQKLALHVEQTPLAVIGWGLDFEVTEWNLAAEKMFGYTKEEAIGKHASFIVPDIAKEQVNEVLQQLLANKGGLRSTNENITKDGIRIMCEWYNTPLVDGDDSVIGVSSLVMDVTARKRAEEERARLMLAIEQAEEVILITDADADIQYVNPAFERVTGYSREEVIGQNPRILQSGQHRPEFYRKMWRTLTAGNTWSGQLVNRKKDGAVYTEEASISPVFDEGGQIINYVAAKRDATHELELEDQLRQAQKMEAVGQMAGGIAHDFNNLLQVISGYVELSEMSVKPGDALAPALREIGTAAQRGKKLITQLLAFSRRQVIQPHDLNLNDVIGPLLNMVRGIIGEHIELDFIAGRELGTIHADRGMMEQVLMNLCVNARDAMPEKGKLTIETENVLIDGDYARTHSWASSGRYVLLSVTDTGCGMTPETQEKVFEPFFTTKEVGRGTGLGLSTVFGIVKQHDGNISIYSEPGKGTIFKIYLPAVERNATEVSRKVAGPVAGGNETILVAEDDESVLALAEYLLGNAGYTVLTAKNGEEAVCLFKQHADQIDAVMFDVVMPRLGGKEATEQILKLRPGLPHLFASGYNENAVHTNFIQKRGLHLLNKPYQTETLLRKIREVLDEK